MFWRESNLGWALDTHSKPSLQVQSGQLENWHWRSNIRGVNSIDRGAWRATVQRVPESDTTEHHRAPLYNCLYCSFKQWLIQESLKWWNLHKILFHKHRCCVRWDMSRGSQNYKAVPQEGPRLALHSPTPQVKFSWVPGPDPGQANYTRYGLTLFTPHRYSTLILLKMRFEMLTRQGSRARHL